MSTAPIPAVMPDVSGLISKQKRIILGELKVRSLWFVRLRWWVPPSVALGAFLARRFGIGFSAAPIYGVALFILVYNVFLFLAGRALSREQGPEELNLQRFTHWQVALDYAAMFLLIHFTGGAASPLIFFFIFHIIFASILLPSASAYGFAALAAAGMAGIAAAEYLNLIPHHALFYHGQAIDLAMLPVHMTVELGFFAASVFITAFSTTSIMRMLRKRMVDLAELSEAVTGLNNKLNSLHAMTQAVGSIKNLAKVLDIVTGELAQVMGVQAISVKLLSIDRRELRYAAVFGLPEEFWKGKAVEVDKSPINRRIIEGEPFATGRITQREMFQFGEDLDKARIQSVLFVPMFVEDRVIGILGAYCTRPDRFQGHDVDFFRLAAGVAAIAVDNAGSYESIEKLVKDRSWFMMKVAHNLRAPLAAVLSILEVVREGYYGPLTPEQDEYLRRIDRRARTMLDMVRELMSLAESRSDQRAIRREPVTPEFIAGRVQRTFQDKAAEKRIAFTVSVAPGLPPMMGDPELIEQMMENLVSNAVKYTPDGGKVGVAFTRSKDNRVRIEVSDNGIGIPKADVPRLFTEFFRSDNAKAVEDSGTGLGLAIVKEIVDQHGGRIVCESEEGLGTIFCAYMPT